MGSLATYGSLLGVNARGSAFIEVVKPQLHELLRSLIVAIEVDEKWYLNTYGDVAAAVDSGNCASGKDHYRTAGYFEDRMPRRIEVNQPWYLSTYPDVEQAIADRKFASAAEHFEREGFREGRLPAEGWKL